MALCDICHQEMLTADGCQPPDLRDANHRAYPRIPFGQEQRYGPNDTTIARCHDCNVLKGRCHHPGCDVEECPQCARQLICCGCFDEI